MEFPDLKNNNVSRFLNRADIIKETAEQIMKDFGIFGLTISFPGNIENAYQELHGQLIDQINVLLVNDYGKLLSVLYQVDITEKEITHAEMELPDYNQVEIIAHQIIFRDLKKVLIRNYFKMQKKEKGS